MNAARSIREMPAYFLSGTSRYASRMAANKKKLTSTVTVTFVDVKQL